MVHSKRHLILFNGMLLVALKPLWPCALPQVAHTLCVRDYVADHRGVLRHDA
jgi:hypothetical protein